MRVLYNEVTLLSERNKQMLHVRGFAEGGYCFMIGDKAVSVVEALRQNGKKFHKRELNALNRKNLANLNDLRAFEQQVTVLNKGLNHFYIIQILRNEFGIDFKSDFHELPLSTVLDILDLYQIAKYRAPAPQHRNGSQTRYFYQYLKRIVEKTK